MLQVAGGGDQAGHLLRAEHHGQRAWHPHGLHAGHQFGLIERDLEEELQSGDRGIERHGRDAVVDQMQLVAPQVLDGGGVGRAPEECGELTDHADITGLGSGCELAHAHVVDHALAQRTDTLAGVSHGSAPVEERGGLPRT